MFNGSKRFSKVFEEAQKSIVNKYPDAIDEIWLFGSCARDENTSGSDIDILVVCDYSKISNDELRDIIAGFDTDLLITLDVSVTSISKNTKSAFDNIKNEDFRKEIEKDAVLTYKKEVGIVSANKK